MDVFTLVSGDFVYGAAALCNSLRAAKFEGAIHVGYMGELEWTIHPSAPIIVHRLDADGKWMGNHKPNFIMDHASGTYLYIDADCIITTSTFIEAVREAVLRRPVFCAEAIIARNDIRRLRWRAAKERSLGLPEDAGGSALLGMSDIYYNSGFFSGDVRRDRWVLEGWRKIIDASLRGTGALYETPDFPFADQDCLNALIQDESTQFYCVSPPDVWFPFMSSAFFHIGTHGSALLHCTGGEKPWRHSTVRPRAPHIYERAWYHYLFEDTGWVQCRPFVKGSLKSWFQDETWGRGIARAKRLAKQVARG